VAKLGRFALIPVAWHAEEPLRQRMVLLKGAGDVATAFYKYLQNAAARQLFIRYGFVLPGDTAQ
jgi:molybdate transport system substrate-binding protein